MVWPLAKLEPDQSTYGPSTKGRCRCTRIFTHSFSSMPPGTAMINVTSDGHHFFHTKYSATKNKTTPIHSPEPNSVNARSTLTNVRVRCAWNHPATSWSGPVRGF